MSQGKYSFVIKSAYADFQSDADRLCTTLMSTPLPVKRSRKFTIHQTFFQHMLSLYSAEDPTFAEKFGTQFHRRRVVGTPGSAGKRKVSFNPAYA